MNEEEQAVIEEEITGSIAYRYRRFPSARFYASVLIMLVGFVLSAIVMSFLVSAISWLPDFDFRLEPILHHRSIITHSILIPGLLALILLRLMIARVFVGIIASAFSVHLFADVLSPAVGYGEIWIPPGTFLSLGALSPIFVLLNAAASFALAIIIFPMRLRSELVAATFASGLQYGIFNERAASTTIFIVLMLAVVTAMLVWRGKISDTPHKLIAQFRLRRDQELSSNADYDAAERDMLLSMSPIRRAQARMRIAVVAIYTTLRWVVVHPAKVALSTCVIAAIGGALYLLGSTDDGGDGGALSAVGNGVWVLHSSGGYILTESGKYVAGTMRGNPP